MGIFFFGLGCGGVWGGGGVGVGFEETASVTPTIMNRDFKSQMIKGTDFFTMKWHLCHFVDVV